jgi:hypothetical protein
MTLSAIVNRVVVGIMAGVFIEYFGVKVVNCVWFKFRPEDFLIFSRAIDQDQKEKSTLSGWRTLVQSPVLEELVYRAPALLFFVLANSSWLYQGIAGGLWLVSLIPWVMTHVRQKPNTRYSVWGSQWSLAWTHRVARRVRSADLILSHVAYTTAWLIPVLWGFDHYPMVYRLEWGFLDGVVVHGIHNVWVRWVSRHPIGPSNSR